MQAFTLKKSESMFFCALTFNKPLTIPTATSFNQNNQNIN